MKRLLFVDDEEDLLFMAALAAERSGKFTVATARDGAEGLARARSFRPDVAVVDAVLPKLDGFELCRRLRGDRRTRDLPIVILSAGEPLRGEKRAKAAGADRYVRKPYDQDELLKLLVGLAGKKKGRPAAAGRPSAKDG